MTDSPTIDTAERPGAGVRLLFKPFEPSRAMVETCSLAATWPLLYRHHAPDDHAVLVVPGLGGGNIWTVAMRTLLSRLGYNVHGIARNSQHGLPGMVVAALTRRIDELYESTGRKVSVVAWSVGGAYARQAVLLRDRRVRSLITLGAPMTGPWYTKEGREAQGLLPVPTTAVVSRTDGVYDWHRCLAPTGPLAENVSVISSHFGLANNPSVLGVVSDRLSQQEGAWQPYRSGLVARGVS